MAGRLGGYFPYLLKDINQTTLKYVFSGHKIFDHISPLFRSYVSHQPDIVNHFSEFVQIAPDLFIVEINYELASWVFCYKRSVKRRVLLQRI